MKRYARMNIASLESEKGVLQSDYQLHLYPAPARQYSTTQTLIRSRKWWWGGAPKIPQWTTSALSHINLRRSDSWSPLWKAFGERLAHANYRD